MGFQGFIRDQEYSERDYRRRTRTITSYNYGWEEEEEDDDDDIDEKAENFIAKFRRQLSLERHLEFKYCTTYGFEGEY